MRQSMYHGIINIYKEPGYTSHDVVARLRGILRQKKIGHTGTLDPAAEGVLPVCLGAGTRLCEAFAGETKTYEAVLLLGLSTDTQDVTGQTLADRSEAAASLSEEAVRRAVLSFEGGYNQIPPMYSALKVGGKKLYELARAGKEVERRPRWVDIPSISIESMELPRVRIRVDCSKGTYIRTLCHDIGEQLGCGGCMERLVRLRVGQFLRWSFCGIRGRSESTSFLWNRQYPYIRLPIRAARETRLSATAIPASPGSLTGSGPGPFGQRTAPGRACTTARAYLSVYMNIRKPGTGGSPGRCSS